ncbi:ATP-binding protein [Streptomyces sp. NBC_01571]|uniref:ATP-binding protein n=1 Tax=Streptomyces sp. NBC_01571 TaxID=2975883 RepID=UPI00225A6AAC|nr:ATP-binding protein [Streptomyces sp. NBC_01571]MCX4575220.1 ATP-binding protein [Streptomyces sp. NBC_01571]
MIQQVCMSRKPWDLAFLAEPEEVAALRRIVRLQLELWGLQEATDTAQLCVSELVSNVITHVGPGTPTTLAVSIKGTYLRIEVHDPDTRALPTLLDATADSEGGRGMALVGAIAEHWGVQLHADRKVTWCELATGLNSPNSHTGGAGVARAGVLLSAYGSARAARHASPSTSTLAAAMAAETAVDAITDLLHWLQAHGRDVDDALERAQRHFEAEACAGEENRL